MKRNPGRGGEEEGRRVSFERTKGGNEENETNLGDSNDHVLDQRSDGSETSDVLSSSVPDRQGDGVGLLDLLEVERKEGREETKVSSRFVFLLFALEVPSTPTQRQLPKSRQPSEQEEEVYVWNTYELDVHVDVPDVLVENSSRPGHLDDSRLDGDSDALGDGEVFGLKNVLHLRGVGAKRGWREVGEGGW